VSAKVRHALSEQDWSVSSVYGPSRDADRPAFLEELHSFRQVRLGPWMICRDLNMIYHTQDKNKNWLHRRRMGQFCRFITGVALKEVHLEGRLYTWSNERSHPTLERIDMCFISTEWDLLFPGHELMSMASLCSDNASLLLRLESSFAAKKRFMFRSFWPSFPSFRELLERAW
jgi:hypothetical protein